MKTHKFLLGTSLLFIGLICIGWTLYLVWDRNQPVNTNLTPQVFAKELNNYPVSISVPGQNLVLPVFAATLQNGKWEDPKHSVAFWKDSPLPGDKGNSVFYGHNWPNIFGKLTEVKVGDSIKIGLADGSVRNFTVAQTYVVTADQTHILESTDDARVTLYTCTGFLDSRRFVVVANVVK